MKLLLDTHILLWWLGNDRRLTPNERAVITNPEYFVFVSAASIWEMSIKKSLGKLSTPDNLLAVLKANNFRVLDITAEHSLAIANLPEYHKDPFDRMLIVQAQTEELTLISQDSKFSQYDVTLST
ncbi:type II toxin-antitoxin system VapC family toxin (plasmid) [Synechocystis sp. PCC 7339]|uniref:type II toxin-antitoxin system VapC family toxin n=1 Tax=unclassified Synechocystis TaxID=2640012 RepID=UPI001BB0BABE|nr:MULTISPECIES: type II toxin-antitoxin system VapC family toxin [unclassified Synechocystis]QUS62546.1 type II toxin-antitoxin system VapC family toxin [Synechocystis sp. PCC 7338]UAJ74640.1 type II toxin-antitoxin system VapC family toxin [Synechocystis sp. PCC 7339]